jgi:hypothetical protein
MQLFDGIIGIGYPTYNSSKWYACVYVPTIMMMMMMMITLGSTNDDGNAMLQQ